MHANVTSGIRPYNLNMSILYALQKMKVADLKVKPGSSGANLICNCCKFLNSHFRKLIVVNNRPASGRLTFNDITRCRFTELFTIDAMPELNSRSKACQDLLRCNGCLRGQNCDKVQRDL